MELDFAQQRQQAHLLIDVLPEEKLSAVHSLLEVLVEPLSRSLAMAPVEDEDLTRRPPPPWIAPAHRWHVAKASPTKRSCASSACE